MGWVHVHPPLLTVGLALQGPGTSCNATCEQKGIASLTSTMNAALANLKAANSQLGSDIKINVVQFDCESEWAGSFGNAKAPAVQRTNELVYNATRAVFPSHDVAIVQYDYVSATQSTAAPRPLFAPLR